MSAVSNSNATPCNTLSPCLGTTMIGSLSSLASGYERLLVNNTSEVASIESSLRSLSYFLPGRFQDAEVASEGLFAALNLLSSWHDSILIKAANDKLSPKDRPKSSQHARLTSFWRDTSTTYATASRLLTLLNATSLLLEMLAHKRLGRKSKWRVVVTIEFIKTILRLTLFRATKYRPLVDPPLPEREVEPSIFQQQQADTLSSTNPPRSAGQGKTWTGERTGMVFPSISSLATSKSGAARFNDGAQSPPQVTNASINAFLAKQAISPQDFKSPEQLLPPLTDIADRWNEVVRILRPLIYVLALQRWGRRAFKPFLVSLILEYLTSKASESRSGQSKIVSDQEGRRQLDLLKYFLRGPLWENVTRPKISSIANGVARIPLVGSLAGTVIKDYLELYERYFYYVGS